jgi:hypothetical protein
MVRISVNISYSQDPPGLYVLYDNMLPPFEANVSKTDFLTQELHKLMQFLSATLRSQSPR